MNFIRIFLATILAVAFPLAATAASPYAGLENRELKALSGDEMNAYREGKGMRLSLAAELNHYPGPAHVLELADDLRLSKEQRERTTSLLTTMRRDAQALGRSLVDAEIALDRSLASGTVTPESLGTEVRWIARLQGELRLMHMQAHLAQRAILTPEQITRYDALRGYGVAGDHAVGGGHGHQH